jgi:insulysin
MQYPVENDYSQYLSAHSGYSNAYTAPTETNFFFEVAASAEESPEATTDGSTEPPLRGALDRFAQFFISPLFLAETLDRELRAVDSENKKNLQSDNWRLAQLDKSLSNPKHPYHHFSTGNLQSLRDEPLKRGVDLRQAFIEFHRKHYSANRMKLVVLGRESLDELESWVVELFSDVQNKELPKNAWPEVQPYTPDTVLKQIFAKPVMDSRSLEISFSYQNEENLYETHPSRYLSHLIGHEGPGSILAYVKAKGWANALGAGAMDVCPDSALFPISIRLTQEGLNHYQEIVEVIFQYIALLKETPPQEWIAQELMTMETVDFRFKQKNPASKFASKMSSNMQQPFPREWLMSGNRLIRRFDSQALVDALKCLRADNFRLTVVSQDFPGNWDQKEKWYGTEYRVEDIPEDFLAKIRAAINSKPSERPSELYLPQKNEFIPTRLDVERKEVAEPTKAPKLIRRDPGMRLWWKKDDRFWVPKANFIARLRNPLVSVTPANHVKAVLFCELVTDLLNEYSYAAEIAGLNYGLNINSVGVIVEVSGYSDKMHVLLERVLLSMRDLEVKPDRFNIMKEKLTRAFRNWEYQQPFHQVGEYMRWITTANGWLNEQYLSELAYLTEQDIISFIPQLLSQVHVEALAHGNLYKEDALRLASLIDSILKPRALPPAQWNIVRNLILPSGSDYTYKRNLADPANLNNCIEYYLYIGALNDEAIRAKALLLAQLSDEQGFDTLRTKEQLGYIVFTGQRMGASTAGYRIIIQSERSPQYLEERINAFLVTLGDSIRNMSASDFDGHRRSVISRRLEKLKNLDEELNRFWKRIAGNYFDFLQADIDVQQLRAITQQDMIHFFDQFISPTSPHRAKFSVHLIARASPQEVAKAITADEQVTKLNDVLSKFLISSGVNVEYEALAKHTATLDLSNVSSENITTAIRSYLQDDAAIPADRAEPILKECGGLMSTVLPGLGIELAQHAEGDGELAPAPKMPETTVVEDVPAFKNTMQLTAAPSPVVDLSTYEELESKL